MKEQTSILSDIIVGNKGNEYGRGKQVARCGNAVCPPMAEAVIRANYAACDIKLTTMMALERMVAV